MFRIICCVIDISKDKNKIKELFNYKKRIINNSFILFLSLLISMTQHLIYNEIIKSKDLKSISNYNLYKKEIRLFELIWIE